MRAKSDYPTMHAGQHDPDGSDPLKFGPIVNFEFLAPAADPRKARSNATFIGAVGPRIGSSLYLGMTLAVLGNVGDVIEIAYGVYTPKQVSLILSEADVLNFTTGQVQRLHGNTILAAGGSFDFLTWDVTDAGPTLLDFSGSNIQPSLAVAGLYVINATISVDQF